MGKVLLVSIVLLLLIAVIIVGLGKPFVTLLDSIMLSKPLDVVITHQRMQVFNFNTLLIEEFPYLENIRVYSDASITMDVDGNEFPLGVSKINPSDSLIIGIIPDKGDRVWIRYEHSCVGWWTPLDINFFIPTPTHQRNSYYQLTWEKADGVKLIARWRFLQKKYTKHEWPDGRSPTQFKGETGLVQLFIKNN